MKYPEQKINFTPLGLLIYCLASKRKTKCVYHYQQCIKILPPLREQQKFSKNKTYRLLQHYKYRNN